MQPPTTTHNKSHQSRTTHNHPQLSQTTQNHSQPSTTTHNDYNTHNNPQPPKNYPRKPIRLTNSDVTAL